MTKMKILLVDNDGLVRDALPLAFMNWGSFLEATEPQCRQAGFGGAA